MKTNEYYDFHTHLDQYPQKKLAQQLKNFSGTIVSASMNERSFEKTEKLASDKNYTKNYTIFPTFGVHPKYAKIAAKKIKQNPHCYDKYLEKSKIIGEIGMDFCWYNQASKAEQEIVFRYFLSHCDSEKKYCVIHTKGAEKEICDILAEYPNAKPIIHWYDGSEDIFEIFVKRQYPQTFGVETCRSEKIQSFLRSIPKELILAETDNPESEIWLGGKDNSIFLIEKVYSDIASVLRIEKEQAARIINENSKKILTAAFS